MSHEIQDKVSLELHRRIAAGLPEHPEWLEMARENLARWSDQNADAPGLLRFYRDWQATLEWPVVEIQRFLMERSDEGQRMRQGFPFAGVISPREVWAIKRAVREAARAETQVEMPGKALGDSGEVRT